MIMIVVNDALKNWVRKNIKYFTSLPPTQNIQCQSEKNKILHLSQIWYMKREV